MKTDAKETGNQIKELVKIRTFSKTCTWSIALILACLFSNPVHGQLRVGYLGGLNFADLQIKNISGTPTVRLHYEIGGLVEYNLTSSWAFLMEPMYIKKGSKLKNTEIANDYLVIENSYLELPLLVKFSMGNAFRPYVIVGPSIGVLLNAILSGKYDGMAVLGDLNNLTKAVDFSLNTGIGFSLGTGPVSWFMEGRYAFGLTNTSQVGTTHVLVGEATTTASMDANSRMNTKGIQLLVGCSFVIR